MRVAPLFCCLVLGLTAPDFVHAQQLTTLEEDPFNELEPTDADLRQLQPATPRLSFELVGEIPLPGPLPGGGPQLVGGNVEIPVAGGVAVAPPEPGARATVSAGSGRDDVSDEWATDATSTFRVRSRPDGFIEAQRRRGQRWKKVWKLKLPGATAVPPLIHGNRVYIGALDNQIYCVKRKNGHRLWAVDVGGRISKALVWWQGELPAAPPAATARPIEAILAITDNGSQMLALDAARGTILARVELPEGAGKLVHVPLAMPDGRVVVALQKYSDAEAALLLYRLTAAPAAAEAT